jgi:EpsD family peptidyl-prolyl cis-trans isomerase
MRTLLMILAAALPVTGCEKAAADRPAAQVVARVNGAEISLKGPASAEALEKIIDRELLLQRALAAKLDRDPQVMHAIESTRRQILAQAYLERSTTAAAGGSRDEARAFYTENPALFAERKVYRLRQLAVTAPAGLVDTLRTEAGRTRDLDALARWLESRGASVAAERRTQPAERLPLSFLPRLAAMKPGEVAVFATPAGAAVIQLEHAEAAPLGEREAAPLIEEFLAGRRRLESAAAEVRRLREVATIEYLGEFKRGH